MPFTEKVGNIHGDFARSIATTHTTTTTPPHTHTQTHTTCGSTIVDGQFLLSVYRFTACELLTLAQLTGLHWN